MEIILQQDYPSLGYVGDQVRVRGGYARNFLIPRGIALEASSRNMRLLNHKLVAVNARKAKLRLEAEERGKQLSAISLDFNLKQGEKGKAFGSVTAKDIEAALVAKGIQIDRRQIRLFEPIRKSGEFKAPVKLHSDVTVQLTINVVIQAAKSAEKLEVKEPKARKGRKKSAETQEGSEDGSAESADDE